jgi:hypothetical protein
MAMSNQPKGINAFTIGNLNPYSMLHYRRCGIKRYQFIRKFYTHSTNHDMMVKLTFNEYPEEAGITESTTKKMCKTLVLTTTEESDLSAIDENALSKYKMMIQMYLILYKPTDWIIKFGNGFYLCTTFSGN